MIHEHASDHTTRNQNIKGHESFCAGSMSPTFLHEILGEYCIPTRKVGTSDLLPWVPRPAHAGVGWTITLAVEAHGEICNGAGQLATLWSKMSRGREEADKWHSGHSNQVCMIWYDMIRYDMIWYDTIRYDMICYHTVHVMIWYSMMTRHRIIWYD